MKPILIVDDDPLVRTLLEAVLVQAGYSVDLACDGGEALERALTGAHDLVLTDMQMPVLGGLDLIRRVRARLDPGPRIVALTGCTRPADREACLAAGADDFLTKPFAAPALLETVKRNLALPGTGARRAEETRAAAGGRRASPRRFLVVDDDRVCRERLGDILAPHGACDQAVNAREAIDAVWRAIGAAAPYDVVCLDVLMPGGTGLDVLRAMRSLEALCGLHGSDGAKVVMATALRDSKHCVQAFLEGCESFVTKPVRADDLLERLREFGVLPADGRDPGSD